MMRSENKKEKQEGSAFGGFLRYLYGNIIVLLLGFVSIPLITRVMSNEQYGRTGMFTSAVTVIYIFAILGMDQAYIRYYYTKGIDRRELLARCLFPALGIVILLCVIYCAFSVPANDFLFGEQGRDLTGLVIAYTIISVFERFLFLDIRMSQNGRLYSNLNITSKVIYIILIVLFARIMGDDFRVVLWAMTLSLGVVTLGIGIRYLALNIGRTEKMAPENTLSQKELTAYGIPFILVLLTEWVLASCDKWSLRIWSDYGELGIYNSAMNIMSILLTFKATFVAFWSPVAMEKYENRDKEECIGFFKSAFKITRCLCILAAIGLILFRGVIVYILGPKYREASGIIPFLTLMPIFSILFEIVCQGIKFTKKNRYLNYASFVAIVFNMGLNAVLVPIIGGKGAALATAVTYLAYFAIGCIFSEKCYAVGYDNVKTAVYAMLLLAYAFETTFFGSFWRDILCGGAAVVLVILADLGTIKTCLGYLFRRKT